MISQFLYKVAGSVFGIATLLGGFYMLYLAFLNRNLGVTSVRGLLGGAMILIGMLIMVKVRTRS
jgi:hypothetical protein